MAAITVNVEQSDKDTFNSICAKMGMNISTAINIFIKAVNRTRTIPFKIRAEEEYNDETLAACKEALGGIINAIEEKGIGLTCTGDVLGLSE